MFLFRYCLPQLPQVPAKSDEALALVVGVLLFEARALVVGVLASAGEGVTGVAAVSTAFFFCSSCPIVPQQTSRWFLKW